MNVSIYSCKLIPRYFEDLGIFEIIEIIEILDYWLKSPFIYLAEIRDGNHHTSDGYKQTGHDYHHIRGGNHNTSDGY